MKRAANKNSRPLVTPRDGTVWVLLNNNSGANLYLTGTESELGADSGVPVIPNQQLSFEWSGYLYVSADADNVNFVYLISKDLRKDAGKSF